jgi:hypothetical protein
LRKTNPPTVVYNGCAGATHSIAKDKATCAPYFMRMQFSMLALTIKFKFVDYYSILVKKRTSFD